MSYISPQKLKELELIANRIRQGVIKMVSIAKSGHTGGPLGMADIFTALYFYVLKHDPKNPMWPERDRLILSNGHICPVRYQTLFAAKFKLFNLTVIIDRNNIQIDGTTEDVLPLEPMSDKYQAFNWHVLEMNGHDMQEII